MNFALSPRGTGGFMGDTTIGWTSKTWNNLRGCERHSPGCQKCYAERHAGRFCGDETVTAPNPRFPFYGYATRGKNGARWTGVVNPLPCNLSEPLSWKEPSRIFVNSMSDLFHKDVPFRYIGAVFAVMAACPDHRFQTLTKRADVMLEWFTWLLAEAGDRDPCVILQQCLMEYFTDFCPHTTETHEEWCKHDIALEEVLLADWPLPNVELGVSSENQKYADERVPLLLQCPAAVHWVSVEPQLGYITLLPWLMEMEGKPRLGWCVQGGESGPGARPFDLGWARSLRDQCAATGTPWFFKQTGSNAISDNDADRPRRTHPGDAVLPTPFRWKVSGKGADQADHPVDLRVQQYPAVRNE